MTTLDLAKPPTQVTGYSDYSTWGFSLGDTLEHIASLHFPASVAVYAEMRRDPQLAAVMAGITLPIRRASWGVDATGCRPEVAQLVADDLGLPLLGTDEPTAARVRGVSWSEHLRAALNHLVFGFYGFEMLADVSSGQARLVGLYERVPATIAYIHSTPTGDFGGISQLLRPDDDGAPEITADRMVWYVHDREGAAWHGTSIMRPGYSSWLLKQSLRRVLAISNERFGTGVPAVEWDPGVIPTQEQMEAAQRAASAARVGNTAGLAMPPGARLVLKGLVGGSPDTLAALRWADEQISGMVLSRWMDLGSTQNGSRALGESFIDTFLLSLQSLADDICDVATRQIAARIVGWNYGSAEPVPRVAVSDVGTRHEVTADALGALLSSGALSADPELEQWVRRTYRLPPRDPSVPWEPPKVRGGGSGGDGSATDRMASVAASKPTAVRKRPRAKRVSAGQTALPIAAATADTADEPPDAQAEQEDHDAAVAVLVAALAGLAPPIVAAIVAAVGAGLAAGGGAALTRLVPGADGDTAVNELADRIGDELVAVAKASAERAANEAQAHGADVSAEVDEAALRDHAQATAHLIADGLSQSATRTALLHAGDGVDASVVEAAVESALTDQVAAPTGWVAQTVSSAVAVAQHDGRMTVFDQIDEQLGQSVKWAAHEVRPKDKAQCQPCTEVDRKVFESYAEAKAAYPRGSYVACAGGPRCRGRLIPSPA